MEKQKRWQLYLILAVIVLTVYNILPTILYYSKPLKQPIDGVRAEQVAHEITTRTNELQDDAISWLWSFSDNLGIKASSIEMKEGDPRVIAVTFPTEKQATVFKSYLPRAGALIPFVPAQLELDPAQAATADNKTVLVARQVGIRLTPEDTKTLFQFSSKYDSNQEIAPLYKQVTYDRVSTLAVAIAGTSSNAAQLAAIVDNATDSRYDDLVVNVAKEISDTERSLGKDSPILRRWYASFSQSSRPDAKELIQKYLARVQLLKSELETKEKSLSEELKAKKSAGSLFDVEKDQALSILKNQVGALNSAIAVIEKNMPLFQAGQAPLAADTLMASLNSAKISSTKDPYQELSLEGRNPYIRSLVIDWNDDTVMMKLYPEAEAIRKLEGKTEAQAIQKEKLNQMVINEIAHVSSLADETITPAGDDFTITLNTLTNTQSILAFNLGSLAKKIGEQTEQQLKSGWTPLQRDLVRDVYPVRDYAAFKNESAEQQKLGLIVFAPSTFGEALPRGFQNGSIYVIARGLDAIAQKYQAAPDSPDAQLFMNDLKTLNAVLQGNGFIGYSGSSYGIAPEFSKDYIFELNDYYSNVIKATREDFIVKGSKKYAVLDFTDVEQRILARNKIDDRTQEDLLKWVEEYHAAQVDQNPTAKYLVPPPTKNPFWQNFTLNVGKYFRGDDRKVLKWGLDLSGGKTVRIGLRDQNNRPVTNPDDVKQAVNELYSRINNMGVSERTIRIENENIILDFPGSQGISAAELIKDSAMYFHIVNEKFSPSNTSLRDAVNDFLQNVWNEAVVTNRKDVESINEIAWKQLGGDAVSDEIHPRSQTAKLLYENGLRLANPKESTMSHAFNDTLSSIAVLRGNEFSEWHGQTNPLMVVFHNYALAGSSLTDVRVGYDPVQGNVLSFSIKNSYDNEDGSPRADFHGWTSQFAQDEIQGTPKEAVTHGIGWRMAVILNGKVVSSPSLKAALRDAGTISGNFSQREINQLAADLKAGSLSFTPKILSEQNVSPELGKEERTKGIVASLVALAFVVALMVGYYRFAGFVASCAVLFNILIMWGVLQNLDAALTLPGIAAIVLTIGMAVDANVLVFERFREEFKISGRVGSAMQAAYRKAFTAIVDSNVTTIIAAVILLQFDSGPIKGFAVTLIIGILSSMFTSLFMTRYFFAGWVQNPKNKTLTMSEWIHDTKFNFLSKTKIAVIISAAVMFFGVYLLAEQRNSIFGMDFTGGYSLSVDLQEKAGMESSYRVAATNALINDGASPNDVDVRELSRPNQLRIQLGIGMEQNGNPFYHLSEVTQNSGDLPYAYQTNPRMAWVIGALQKAGLEVPESQLTQLEKNWTVMSGQLSDSMRNSALFGLGLAMLSILIYITLRFEFKYAISAVIGLAHDVIITLGILALFHKLGFPVQINLEVIGAIMTIIGYSLNDTIIVFDRIREDLKLHKKMSYYDLVNQSLNVTLGRTLMTSGTTMVVLLALVFLGGEAIFSFSLVMTIGVVVGTLSSLFIATPVLLFFHNREEQKAKEQHLSSRRA